MTDRNPGNVEKAAQRANEQVGYSSNNPEPIQFHNSPKDRPAKKDALEAAIEYVEGKQE